MNEHVITTPLADALAGVDKAQNGAAGNLIALGELRALRILAEAVRVYLRGWADELARPDDDEAEDGDGE